MKRPIVAILFVTGVTLPALLICGAGISRNKSYERPQHNALHKDTAELEKRFGLTYSAAIQQHKVKIVKKFLNNGATTGPLDARGRTPLHIAAESHPSFNNLSPLKHLIALLVEKGANIDAEDRDTYTPLSRAIAYNNVEAIEPLLNAGASIENNHPLMIAAMKGRLEILKMLIYRGMPVKTTAKTRHCPPLNAATSGGWSKCINTLIGAGADSNEPDTNGHTALFLAKNSRITWLLLQAGSHATHRDIFGNTPLHLTAAMGETDTKILLTHLHCAADGLRGWQASCEHLDYFYNHGMRASSSKHLLQAGADINAQNSHGLTPLQIATHNGHYDTMRILLEAGAHLFERINTQEELT